MAYTILRNFYVDDCLKSLSSSSAAVKHEADLRKLMSIGRFNLAKWASNDRQVLESIPPDERAKDVKELDFECDMLPTERALGVSWLVETDALSFKVIIKEKPCTRRGILSVVSLVYDPLGMAAPFVLPAKLLLQDLCRKGLGWDDEIPCLHLSRWQTWLADLPRLSELSMKRCVQGVDLGKVVTNEIHHFCDASQCAYGAVSYLRQVDSERQAHCSFLVGQSRLAPLKQMSIPRLELAAATVSVRLNRLLKNELEIPIDKITFWTDSMTVLRYIANESKRFHTYIANRVAIIREDSSPSQWRYIKSKSNPVDDASRGTSADAFILNDRWIKGPDFLLKPPSEWIKLPKHNTELSGDDPEVKRESKSFVVDVRPSEVQSNVISLVQRFSSWLKLLKFIAVCLRCQRRFITRKRKSKQDGFDRSSQAASLEPLTCSEINDEKNMGAVCG